MATTWLERTMRRGRRADHLPHQLWFIMDNPLRRLVVNPRRIVDRLELSGAENVLEVGPGPGLFSVALAGRLTAAGEVGHMGGRRAEIEEPTVAAQGPGPEQKATHRHRLYEPSVQLRLGAATVVGAGCWLLTVAYFVVQPVVAAAWQPPYDVAANAISDLGITGCGTLRQFDDRVIYACSPRHALMNAVFVVVGLLTGAGALLTRAIWPRRRLTTAGVTFVVLAGVGGILVGLAPADVNLAAHGAGALLQVPGAVGPLLLGVAAWSVRPGVAAFSLVCGVVGSAGCLLYFGRSDLGLGPGVMERLAFDPLTVWTIALGAVLLGRSLVARRNLR